MKYSNDLVEKVNKLKESAVKLADKVNNQEDARIACGELYDIITSNWKDIDSTIFAEEHSELERQIDAAIEQVYRIST